MKLLGTLTQTVFEKLFNFIAGFLGVKYATRITAIAILAAGYISCVGVFTTMIVPWFGALVGTAYGALLGLLFPPVAGTVIAALFSYKMCVVALRYTSRLMKMAIT